MIMSGEMCDCYAYQRIHPKHTIKSAKGGAAMNPKIKNHLDECRLAGKAVNSHDALLRAAKQARTALYREIHPEGMSPSFDASLPPALEALDKAITLAEGEKS